MPDPHAQAQAIAASFLAIVIIAFAADGIVKILERRARKKFERAQK